MLETIKNLMLASLGAAVLTKEKAMQFMDQAVQRGEMSAAEAEKVADEVVAESKRQAQEWRQDRGCGERRPDQPGPGQALRGGGIGGPPDQGRAGAGRA